MLGLEDDGVDEREEAKARIHAAEAALARLDELADEDWVREDTAERMRGAYRFRTAALPRRASTTATTARSRSARRTTSGCAASCSTPSAQRSSELRNSGAISNDVWLRVGATSTSRTRGSTSEQAQAESTSSSPVASTTPSSFPPSWASACRSSCRTRSRRDAELTPIASSDRCSPVEAEAQLEDPPLHARAASASASPNRTAAQRVARLLEGVDRVRIGEAARRARRRRRSDRLVQGDRGLDRAERLLDVLRARIRWPRELLQRRLASVLDLELAAEPGQLARRSCDVRGDADRLRLIRDRPLAGLADPPGRVGRELEALAPVELLDRAVEADDALLDEVAEAGRRDPGSASRCETTRRRFELIMRSFAGLVATLDALRELDLLGRGQQSASADLVHEQGQRVGRHGGVGLEAELGLVIRLVLVLVRGQKLHSAGLELRAQGCDLVVLELELECQRDK